MVDEALGEEFAEALVSDFYAACHHNDGPKQRCWAHLLRDIHDLRALCPRDGSLAWWADAVHGVYEKGQSLEPPRTAATTRRSFGPGTLPVGPVPPLPGRSSVSPGQAVPTRGETHQEPAPYWIRATLRLRGPTGGAAGPRCDRTQPAAAGDQPGHPIPAGH